MQGEDALAFVVEMLKKAHVPVCVSDVSTLLEGQVDMGLRHLLGIRENVLEGCVEEHFVPRSGQVYLLTCRFGCQYLFFVLPDHERLFLVGPYLSRILLREEILEKCEELSIPPVLSRQIEQYYGGLPVISAEEYLFACIDSLFARLYPGRVEDHVVTLRAEQQPDAVMFSVREEAGDKKGWNVHLMEQRYAYENEMLLAVTRGQVHKARGFLHMFSLLNFEKRLTDPVRNLKNYCIIMNTLLRKAAEKGGVHPVFLDRMSSSFAMRIEQMNSVNNAMEMMVDMFESYCRLVRQHNTGDYSPPVRRAIAAIESDLTQNLSLSALADKLSVSKSYLSGLFKKETGMTVTDYVNTRRIEYAAVLLSSTTLQVQTVAQHCGMVDVQYFSKLFKKIKGETPHAFRRREGKKENDDERVF